MRNAPDSNGDENVLVRFIDGTFTFVHGRVKKVSDLASDLAFIVSFDFAPALVPLGPAIFIGVALYSGTAENIPNEWLRGLASASVGAGFQGAGMRLSQSAISYYHLMQRDESQTKRFYTSAVAYLLNLALEIGAVWVIEDGDYRLSLLVTFVVLVAALVSVSKAMTDDIGHQSSSAKKEINLEAERKAQDRAFEVAQREAEMAHRLEQSRLNAEARRDTKRAKVAAETGNALRPRGPRRAILHEVAAQNEQNEPTHLTEMTNAPTQSGVIHMPLDYALPLDAFASVTKMSHLTDAQIASLTQMSRAHFRYALRHINKSTRNRWRKKMLG